MRPSVQDKCIGLFLFPNGSVIPQMTFQIILQIIVIAEAHIRDRISVQDRLICLEMDGVQLSVLAEQVGSRHQGKGGIRILCLQLMEMILAGRCPQLVYAGDAVKDDLFLLPVKPDGMGCLRNG